MELGVGDLRIVATDRSDTEVEVRPSDPANTSDVAGAEHVRVEYADGRLLVKARRQHTLRGGGESVAVQINLPVGSEVRGYVGVGMVRIVGRIGECHFKTGVGELQVDEAGGPVWLRAGSGDVTLGRASGPVDVTTGSGALRIASTDGSAAVKNSNGDTWIGEVVGDLRAKAANGRIVVDRAHATVVAKAANGDVHLGEVTNGAIVAETACGTIDIGVVDGVTAWLDLHTRFGDVRSELDAVERPEPGQAAVEVRARTSFGDVTVSRAHPGGTDEEVA